MSKGCQHLRCDCTNRWRFEPTTVHPVGVLTHVQHLFLLGPHTWSLATSEKPNSGTMDKHKTLRRGSKAATGTYSMQ